MKSWNTGMSARKPAETKPGHRAGEFDLIARYFAPLAGPGGFGLGDDAAVLLPTPGQELVFTADAIIAGIHFLSDDPPADVAAKLRVVLAEVDAVREQEPVFPL